MSKLLNRSLRKLLLYAGIVLVCSVPVYYWAISSLWQLERNEHNIVLTREASREDSFLIIGAVTLVTVLFFILLLGGFILVNRKISRQLWQPFYNSLQYIKNFDLQQQQPFHFEQTDIDEFTELNQSLDKLISGNIAVYNQQKEFADNASHELQTPLAIVQSKLEVLIQSRSLTDEQYRIIEDALKALSRVSRINKNLLLLTKIENSQYMDTERINLSELVMLTLAQFRNFSQPKEIAVQADLAPGVTIHGNKTLVEMLLNNLMTNAIRHSAAGSEITVELSSNNLVISNPGPAPLESTQLFKRFATASTQTPGTGLGLALVKQIAKRYHWNIGYTFGQGRHIFSVHF